MYISPQNLQHRALSPPNNSQCTCQQVAGHKARGLPIMFIVHTLAQYVHCLAGTDGATTYSSFIMLLRVHIWRYFNHTKATVIVHTNLVQKICLKPAYNRLILKISWLQLWISKGNERCVIHTVRLPCILQATLWGLDNEACGPQTIKLSHRQLKSINQKLCIHFFLPCQTICSDSPSAMKALALVGFSTGGWHKWNLQANARSYEKN